MLKPAASLEAEEPELAKLLADDSELDPTDSEIETEESENEQACNMASAMTKGVNRAGNRIMCIVRLVVVGVEAKVPCQRLR